MAEHYRAEDAAHEVLDVLPQLNRIVVAAVRRETGEETTMPQFRVLALMVAGPQTVSSLARQRRVSLQSMGGLVQALVERGWVVREPAPNDRRQQLLRLTDAGREHYQRAQAQTLRQLTPLLKELSQAELAAVQLALPALRRVLSMDEERTSDDRP